MQPLLEQACWDTLYMVGWSTLIAVVGGLPLGVFLVLTDRGGQLGNALVNKVIGQVVNITRSMPFIILMVALMPLHQGDHRDHHRPRGRHRAARDRCHPVLRPARGDRCP